MLRDMRRGRGGDRVKRGTGVAGERSLAVSSFSMER